MVHKSHLFIDNHVMTWFMIKWSNQHMFWIRDVLFFTFVCVIPGLPQYLVSEAEDTDYSEGEEDYT